jgi:hypothetical protein
MTDCKKIVAVKSDFQEKYQTPSVHLPNRSDYLSCDRGSDTADERAWGRVPSFDLRGLHHLTILMAAALPTPSSVPFLYKIRGRGLLRKKSNLQVEMTSRSCIDECVKIFRGRGGGGSALALRGGDLTLAHGSLRFPRFPWLWTEEKTWVIIIFPCFY